MILKPGLYIVSTPIGNMDDITIRAINVLKNSDVILCEDTRISRKLLLKHGIQTKLQIYNDHSDVNARATICQLIDQNLVVSLVSDAGTPLVSDPGYKLVRKLLDLGYHIDVIPGVSSPISALTISGLPTNRFLFCGFLPKTTEGKKKIFNEFMNVNATLIFFDAASRLISSLSTAEEVLGNREACVARELTKLHQEVKINYINEIINYYQKHTLKGEIVLLISGIHAAKNLEALVAELQRFIQSHFAEGYSAKTITNLAHQNFGKHYSKQEIYKMVNQMSGQRVDGYKG